MKKVQKFRKRALECREWARGSSTPDLRKNYEYMATLWECLADERTKVIEKVCTEIDSNF